MLLILLSVSLLAGCGSGEVGKTGESGKVGLTAEKEERAFTLEELAQYDGNDGRPAYVAVDGVVYDVTGSPSWPQGVHTACSGDSKAGKDLSDTMRVAPPRMRALLQGFPVVGVLQRP